MLLQPHTEDINEFREASPPFEVQEISVSGMIMAARGLDSVLVVSPSQNLTFPMKVSQVSCGWTHCLILSEQLTFVCGEGSHGQLGLGTNNKSPQPTPLPLENCRFLGTGFRTSFVKTGD